ncbi:MAG: acyl-ACP--UDP-N-acetylglucosamine O-acyltransferase [Desulfatibacillaceae bacterium]
MIHPTTIIHPEAKIGRDVFIGPYCVIDQEVEIGDGCRLGSHVTVDRYTTIGEGCEIHHHAALGGPPQALRFGGEKSWCRIGPRCLIREFVTVNRGTDFGGGVTEIGEGNMLMAYVHVAHDCRLGNGNVLANAATLAGHITVGDHATIGGLVAIHQFVRVGNYAFIGGKSGITKDVPPYVIAEGHRARLHGLNKVGLKRQGFSEDALTRLKRAYRIIFRIGITFNEAIARVQAEVEPGEEVRYFLEFLTSSERGFLRG